MVRPINYGSNTYVNYTELIDSMEYVVVVTESDNDYQGDSYYLLKDGSRYGYLCFGWGSCSGCDALEWAVHSNDPETNVTDLRDNLLAKIVWLDSKEEALEYFRTKDWSLDYGWLQSYSGLRPFVEEVITILSN